MYAITAKDSLVTKIDSGCARILLLLLGAILVGKIAQEVYDWYAFSEERERLESLEPEHERVGLEVVLSQLRVDSLRGFIEATDRELAVKRSAIEAYDRYQRDGELSPGLFGRYRRDLAEYNARVEARNDRLDDWRSAMQWNEQVVDSFNALSDRIRGIAG